MLLPLAISRWSTVSSLATGAGTLVLAVATFAAVRSSNRSARIAEIALQEQRRPIFVPSRSRRSGAEAQLRRRPLDQARRAATRPPTVENGNVYLAISLRNVGNGIGVLQGWAVRAGQTLTSQQPCTCPTRSSACRRATSTSPAATSACGRARCATPKIRCAQRWRRRSRSSADHDRAALLGLNGRQRAITRFGLAAQGWREALLRDEPALVPRLRRAAPRQ